MDLKRKRRRSDGVLLSSKRQKSSLQRRKSLGDKLLDPAIGEKEEGLQEEEAVLEEVLTGGKISEGDELSVDEGDFEDCDLAQSDGGEDSDAAAASGPDQLHLEDERGGAEAGACKKKSGHSSSGLYKPPTHDELQTLKETQNLFKSNLMKLQITELLSEVEVKKTTTSKLESFLHSLREALLSMKSSSQINLCDGLDALKKVKFPLPFCPEHSKGKFKFGPPVGVRVVGSYLVGTSIKSDLNVDLEMCLPVDCLQVKDILNYRYFFKRALYLSLVASHLKKKKKKLGLESVKYQQFRENPLFPILILTPGEKKLSKYSVRLHTSVLDQSYFKIGKLSPERNNVRRSFLSSDEHASSEEEVEPGPATPHYNAHMLMELGARERHLKEIYVATQECPGLVDAIILFKVWAKQRGLDKGYDGFSGFHFSLLASALLLQKKINRLMSCYQIFRVGLQHLCSSDWTSSGFLSASSSSPSAPPLSSFHAAFDVVFVDSTGFLNVCADMSKERYRWLQHEASLALKLLDDSTSHGFQALFMTTMPVEQMFDILYRIPLSQLSLPSLKMNKTIREAMSLDNFAWTLPQILSRILAVLRRGLDKRVKLVVPFLRMAKSWLTANAVPKRSRGHVTIGLLLDTNHAFSILSMGPAADQKKEAAEFRSFWGEKSEMRRFQDGSIKEAVVWGKGEERSKVEKKRDICQRIITHLLRRHFSVQVDEQSCSRAGLLDFLLHSSDWTGSCLPDGEELMQKVCEAFTELGRDLRRMKDIPLSVTSLQGTSPTFRCTEVFSLPAWSGRLPSAMRATPPDDQFQSTCYYPCCEVATPPLVPIHPVVCQLESSGKWPEDLEAVRMVKVAFYIHMAKALGESSKIVASPTKEYLDILKNGYVFRLKLYHHHELVVLREKVQKNAPGPGLSTAAATQLKLEARDMHREVVALPVLTSTLNGLQQQFPMYGRGARLCKRWVSSHLLSSHLSDEAIDLMVAYLFVHPAPFSPPSSDLVVFIRFLSLLSTYDWHLEPLIVNFNNEVSETKTSEMLAEFSKNRSTLPPLVLLTPHDMSASVWTSGSSPPPPVLDRLIRLASATLSELPMMVMEGQSGTDHDVRRLFRSPLEDFNVLIHLHKRHIPCSHQAVDVKTTADSTHKAPNYVTRSTHLPVVDFDPAQLYLKELEVAYSDLALFFYDKYGGAFIAVVWKPMALAPMNFKVAKAHCRVPVGDGAREKGQGEVVVDVDAIVNDFQLLGEGLVKEVQVLK